MRSGGKRTTNSFNRHRLMNQMVQTNESFPPPSGESLSMESSPAALESLSGSPPIEIMTSPPRKGTGGPSTRSPAPMPKRPPPPPPKPSPSRATSPKPPSSPKPHPPSSPKPIPSSSPKPHPPSSPKPLPPTAPKPFSKSAISSVSQESLLTLAPPRPERAPSPSQLRLEDDDETQLPSPSQRQSNRPTRKSRMASTPVLIGKIESPSLPPKDPPKDLPPPSPVPLPSADAEEASRISEKILRESAVEIKDGEKEKAFEKRTKIVAEILATEETYVKQLEVLVDAYHKPLLRLAKQQQEKSGKGLLFINKKVSGGGVVTSDNLKKIFGNCQTLLPLNRELLQRLKERIQAWQIDQVIGDVFLTMAPLLVFYSSYGCGYNEGGSVLSNLLRVDEFAEAVKVCDEKAQQMCPGCIKLENLLITPIQRIPRYVLLVSELLNKTHVDHADYPLLEEALTKIQNVSDMLDRAILEHDNSQRLLDLGKRGANDLVSASRKLRHECTVSYVKKGKEKVKSLRLLIMTDILVHVSESRTRHKSALAQKKHQWPLSLVWIETVDVSRALPESLQKETRKYSHAARLKGPPFQYTLLFRSLEESNQVLAELQSAIDDVIETINSGENVPEEVKKDPEIRLGQYEYLQGGRYDGVWRAGFIEGQGRWEYEGTTYTGVWKSGELTGPGTILFASGDRFDGNILKGLPNGTGTLTCQSGDIYQGGFVEGVRCGRGEYMTTHGLVYIGDWSSNSPSGSGHLVDRSAGFRYEGAFLHGDYNGYGVASWQSPGLHTTYSGEFRGGQRWGTGVLVKVFGNVARPASADFTVTPKGSEKGPGVLQRGWVNSCVQSLLNSSDLEIWYEGQWVEDMGHGNGTLTIRSKVPEIERAKKEDEDIVKVINYSGGWQEGLPEGDGTLIHVDGWTYSGQWRRGKFHGFGTLTNITGPLDSYSGEWVQHRMQGKGAVRYRSGAMYAGQMKGNRPTGAGVYTYPNGITVNGKWTFENGLEGKVHIQGPSGKGSELHGQMGMSKMVDVGAMGWVLPPSLDLPLFFNNFPLSWGF